MYISIPSCHLPTKVGIGNDDRMSYHTFDTALRHFTRAPLFVGDVREGGQPLRYR